jgi:hypothetical protein
MKETSATNPYASPLSDVEGSQSTSDVTAILIGAAIGNGIAYALLSVFGVIFLWILVAQGVPTQDLVARVYQSTGFILFGHAVAFFCCSAGGYWSARLSRDRHLSAALAAGVLLSLLTVVVLLIPYSSPLPAWSNVASVIVPVPAFLLGASWWQRMNRRPS